MKHKTIVPIETLPEEIKALRKQNMEIDSYPKNKLIKTRYENYRNLEMLFRESESLYQQIREMQGKYMSSKRKQQDIMRQNLKISEAIEKKNGNTG